MAEIELNVLIGQCLNRRIAKIARVVAVAKIKKFPYKYPVEKPCNQFSLLIFNQFLLAFLILPGISLLYLSYAAMLQFKVKLPVNDLPYFRVGYGLPLFRLGPGTIIREK